MAHVTRISNRISMLDLVTRVWEIKCRPEIDAHLGTESHSLLHFSNSISVQASINV